MWSQVALLDLVNLGAALLTSVQNLFLNNVCLFANHSHVFS